MNGPHDLGGAHGFGPVEHEANEPMFHAAWERRALAIVLAMGATKSWNIDESRHARESIGPVRYLSSSYYQIWLAGLDALMLSRGLVTQDELTQGVMLVPPKAVAGPLKAASVAAAMAKGGPTERETDQAARFKVGQRVQTSNFHPAAHTRLPRYARGKIGVIEFIHGAHVFADASAAGAGEAPEYLYSVRFEACDLWGADTTADQVFLDCWQPYLSAAR